MTPPAQPPTERPPLHIGCAAGFSGDRVDAAGPVVDALVAAGGGVLVFETLAERTLALAQLARRQDPSAGFEPLLDHLVGPVLERCLAHGIRIVSNFGAANPEGAACRIAALAAQRGLRAPRMAVLLGDDLLADGVTLPAFGDVPGEAPADPSGRPAGESPSEAFATPVSANAYIGATGIAAALRDGADVVVCGRVADPSLVLGPALAHFGWALDDWDRLAGATMAGHLLECGSQVSGGYYADPGFKDVPDMAHIGFPVAEIHADGHCVIGKPSGTGGCIDRHTVTEQLLYEVHDPAAYLTPDVVADITEARIDLVGPDRVRLSGVRGHPAPATLKVNVCHESGWLAEGEISYAGPRAEARARLAAQVLHERLPDVSPLRVDLIGVLSLFGDDAGQAQVARPAGDAQDVRLRVAASCDSRDQADRLTREVTALYTCGPAGGGGVRTSVRPRLAMRSGFIQRDAVRVRHLMLEG